MRVNILFENLLEIDMGSTKLGRVLDRHGSSAHVGFEFEFIVHDSDSDVETMDIDDIGSYDEVEEYFNISRRDARNISHEFDEWVEKDEDARSDSSYDEWIEDAFRDYVDFINEFDLEPSYGWAESGIFYMDLVNDDNHENLFSSIEESISEDSDMGDYLQGVVGDTSISSDSGVGVEVITNPIPLSDVPVVLSKYLSFISDNGHTNGSTGLHINVSLDDYDMDEDIDWLKVGLFLGEDHVLNLFDRVGNRYTSSQLDHIRSFISSSSIDGKSFDELVDMLGTKLSLDKYKSFNISKVGYVEFRMSGGVNYEDNEDDIMETVLRYVRVLLLGADRNASRREYVRKLFNLIKDSDLSSSIEGSSDLNDMLNNIANKLLQGRTREYNVGLFPLMVKKLFLAKKEVSSSVKKVLRREAVRKGFTKSSYRNFVLSQTYTLQNMDSDMKEMYFEFADELLNLKDKK